MSMDDIECKCAFCGAESTKLCDFPQGETSMHIHYTNKDGETKGKYL